MSQFHWLSSCRILQPPVFNEEKPELADASLPFLCAAACITHVTEVVIRLAKLESRRHLDKYELLSRRSAEVNL